MAVDFSFEAGGDGRELARADGVFVAAEFLFEPRFIKPRRRQCFETAGQHQVADVVTRQTFAVNLKNIGVERQPVDCCDLRQIEIDGEIEPPFVDRALTKSTGRIAEGFSHIRGGKFDAAVGPRVFQDAERVVRKCAAAGVWVDRLMLLFFVLARLGPGFRGGLRPFCRRRRLNQRRGSRSRLFGSRWFRRQRRRGLRSGLIRRRRARRTDCWRRISLRGWPALRLRKSQFVFWLSVAIVSECRLGMHYGSQGEREKSTTAERKTLHIDVHPLSTPYN